MNKLIYHKLKIIPPYYDDVVNGIKKFELRKDDREFKVGDYIILKEFIPEKAQYSGRECKVKIKYKLSEIIGLLEGYCILGITFKEILKKSISCKEI